MHKMSPVPFRDLVEFAPDALILVDCAGTIVYANSHAHTLFGYESEELTGNPIEVLIPIERQSAHVAHRNSYMRDPRVQDMGNKLVPICGLRKDGSRFRADIRLAPFQTPKGVVSAAAVRDATESERIMSILAEARQFAEKANAVTSRLLTKATHDLHLPLKLLRLLNRTARCVVQQTNVRDLLVQQEHAIDMMSELLNPLLSIAKLESGTIKPALNDVSLALIFADLSQQLSSRASIKGLQLIVADTDALVLTDSVLLAQLLRNLLTNAIRYTDCGRIELRCAPAEPGRLRIEVADTGVGIPASLHERIFDDFFQAAPRDHRHRGGIGLGLGIVRRLSLLLDVSIQIDSTVGAGTRFMLDVPLATPQREAALDQTFTDAIRNCKGESILLVEEDRTTREELNTFLQLGQHTVCTAASLDELDQLLARLKAPPIVVISDLRLGANNRGSDAIEKIRRHYKRPLPAILLTDDTTALPVCDTRVANIRVVNKPVNAQRLCAVIDELMRACSH